MSRTAQLRKFISATYNDEELKALCFDYFRPVYENITTGMTKIAMITMLIEYCDKHGSLEQLMKIIKQERPDTFPVDLQITRVEPTATAVSVNRLEQVAEIRAQLEQYIGNSPLAPQSDHAYLYLAINPTHSDDSLLDAARGEMKTQILLNDLLPVTFTLKSFTPHSYSPDFSDRARWYRNPEGWTGYLADDPTYTPARDPDNTIDLTVRLDGSGMLFCGRAAERYDTRLLVFEDLIAGITSRTLRFFGELYERAKYSGNVDLGIAVTGLKDGIAYRLSQRILSNPHPFRFSDYMRFERTSAPTLATSPESTAQKLVLPLIDTLTQENYNPFKT